MRKSINICTCDFCKKSIQLEKNIFTIDVPVRFLTEQTEGRTVKPYVVIEKKDVCKNCLEKLVKVEAKGAMGYNEYKFLD